MDIQQKGKFLLLCQDRLEVHRLFTQPLRRGPRPNPIGLLHPHPNNPMNNQPSNDQATIWVSPTAPMPTILADNRCMGLTVLRMTSTMRLAFSSMTPPPCHKS